MKKSMTLLLTGLVLLLILGACSSGTASEKENNNEKDNAEETGENDADNGKEGNEDDNASSEEADGEGEQEKIKGKYEFDRPDTVRGLYATGHSVGGERFDELVDLIDQTDLNSMVIDIKDDEGYLTYKPDDDSDIESTGQPYINDPEEVLEKLHEKDIYPIARIVVFKDSVMAEESPELSFKEGDQVWKNGKGDAFVSPFKKEVWENNLAIAKEAAEMGFQDIQFDYVRFPEGFETRADDLNYDKGDYAEMDDDVEARVQSVTDFVAYAEEELDDYDVDVSVDIFGYTAAVPNTPGIGQDLVKIGEHIDVLSSMIYPSHWGEGSLDIDKPDLKPYETVFEYAVKEKDKLFRMDDPPISRPWIQDFTASWLGSGNYKEYGKEEVEAQIRALNESGIDEFLLWNASNNYTQNVDYTPPMDDNVLEQVEQDDEKLREEIEADEKDDSDENDAENDGAEDAGNNDQAENEAENDDAGNDAA